MTGGVSIFATKVVSIHEVQLNTMIVFHPTTISNIPDAARFQESQPPNVFLAGADLDAPP